MNSQQTQKGAHHIRNHSFNINQGIEEQMGNSPDQTVKDYFQANEPFQIADTNYMTNREVENAADLSMDNVI